MRKPEDGVKRSKSILVLVTPEVQADLKKIASLEGVSANFKAYQLIKQYVLDHQQQVEDYDKLTNKYQSQKAPALRQSIKV